MRHTLKMTTLISILISQATCTPLKTHYVSEIY